MCMCLQSTAYAVIDHALHAGEAMHITDPIIQTHLLGACRREILYLVEHHATTVIVGETGSGKSTQIPQYLLEAGWCSGRPPLEHSHRSVTARVAHVRLLESSSCEPGDQESVC